MGKYARAMGYVLGKPRDLRRNERRGIFARRLRENLTGQSACSVQKAILKLGWPEGVITIR
jgi:hypothetical protein